MSEKGPELPGSVGERIARLGPDKRELLRARLSSAQRLETASEAVPLEVVPRTADLPLSFAQQRLWFLDRLQPGSNTYNMPTAWRLRGPLNAEALARSVTAVVTRHESLRTRVLLRAGAPVQVIDPAPADVLVRTDLTELAPAERESRVQALIVEHARQPFDLAVGPVFRAALLRLTADEHVLMVNVHHIASDGWSVGVFDRELAASYNALTVGIEPTFRPLPIQYADYAVWQRTWLQGPVLAAQRTYWQRQLADLRPLELPTDRPRPPVARHHGSHLVMQLPLETSRSLKALSQREGATLFMTLLAAFQVLLHRYSGQTDIAVGSPIAGRRRPEVEGLIGCFINTLVLRSNLSGDPTFRELLTRVRETALGAYAHQDLPFEKLVEDLAPARDLSRHPLFQVLFVLQNTPGGPLALDHLTVERFPRDIESAKFDLHLSVRELAEGFHLRWEYAKDLFEASTVRRLAGHFAVLLDAIVADPARHISEYALLTEAERHQLLVAWNTTATDDSEPVGIHRLVEAQAARTPDAVAVICADRQLTYAALDARANQVAHTLRALGVGSEALVGLCLERSLDLIVGLLGILKAGGAYVPLDPNYPEARLAFMLSDSRATILVTEQARLAQLAHFDGHVLCLDRDAATIAAQPDTDPQYPASAETLAYVIYTSGSTGTPKGVAITHRSAWTFLQWAVSVFSDQELAGTLFSTSICFDLSVFELFAPLSRGATVMVAENALQLPQLLHAGRVTLINTVPSAMTELVRMGGVPASVRTVNLAGEKLQDSLVHDTYESTHVTRLYNLYGPTEDTTYSTFALIRRGNGETPTIGRPISNTSVYVLDQHLAPVPIGVTGELYLGGAGLARGYWNRSALTPEKFVADPFSVTPGARMYRTGDQVRYRASGDLDFLGRLDDQVKIRGFRIELGEIEAVLTEHPSVRQAVVLAREDNPGDTRLVAYVVPSAPAGIDIEVLRSLLRTRVPDYMQPTAYVVLEQLPLTPAGKLDRRALPTPQYGRAAIANAFVAPRNSTEEAIVEVWREVLRIERVGVHDNFFELGGHSLLATQVLARLGRVLQIDLSLHRFFEAPTVSGQAAEAQQLMATSRETIAPGLVARAPDLTPAETSRGVDGRADTSGASVTDLPLSFAQQRLWFLDRFQPGDSTYNMPTAWRLQGPLELALLERSMVAVVARHESLRTRIVLHAGAPVQVIDPVPSQVLVVTDLSASEPAEREVRTHALIEAHARRPFDLATGPLFRADVLRLAADEHVLLVNVHHIASDGWSVGVFHRELAAAYAALVRGTEPALPALPIQYADYAVWQRAWLQGPVLAAQRAYWRRKLADLPPLELPTDRPRPPIARQGGAHLTMDLPAQVTVGLKVLGAREGATLFMTLLAAFQVLLYRHSGQTDIAVGSPIAGRGRPELEGLIGFFVNTLVLRSDLSDEPPFVEFLSRVRKTALEAYTHQDLPFEKIVEDLAPARDLSRQPLFQVLFVLQNTPGPPLVLEGLDVSRVVRETESVKFDLSLAVRESADGLHLRWEYASDLFEASTIARMAGHFERLLEAIVADPARGVGDLPLLTQVERDQLLVAWNATATDYPSDRCVHQLVETQVARTPDAVAVVCGDQHLTYTTLNTRANQVAHQLRALGVGPEVLVGVCLERSLDLIVALLGILKAGGVYVPLDPTYPQSRLSFMLNDTRAPVLVTQLALVPQLPGFDGHLLCLDRDAVSIQAQPDTNPDGSTTADALAYVMYTSGSTGQPKGVAVCHRGITRLVRNTNYVELDSTDCVAQISNPAFDASTFEVWGALANGSSLIIIPRDVALNLPRLADELRSRRISTMFLTVALFNEIVRERANAFEGLKQLLVGGEAVDPHWMGECLRAGGPRRLQNAYGPTECTTFATWFVVESVMAATHTIPIGRPIANTVAYVLDTHRQPVPIGVAGELYIGGAGLARGYWNRPELTTEKFVPDPYSRTPGARLYRTGDRVRYLANGDLEFLGRLDDQVKIRGFRIELGEIEALLGAHPGVRQTVVLAREETQGDKRLVAYVVPADAVGVDIESLRAFVRERLPDYMRPTAYVVLDGLPLTATGKIDRRALPAPSRGTEAPAQKHESPRDEVERTLCQLWGDVLKMPEVGIDDDFFELGGHSLLAAQLFARMDQAFGRSLPLATLFDAPTIRALARFYRDGEEPALGVTLVAIAPSGTRPAVFAVPGVGGNVLGYRTLAHELGSDQPFFGLQSVGLDGGHEPLQSIEQIAAHHVSEVRRRQPRGPYHLVGACFGATVAVEMTHQLLDAGEQVSFLALFDPSALGWDLADRPMVLAPGWARRGMDLARFVAKRLRRYFKQIRPLGPREKMQLVGSKIKVVGEIVRTRDLFRGDERQFHQRRVKAANVRALRRYKHRPMARSPKVIEVFRTSRRFDLLPSGAGVDWVSLVGKPITYHHVAGKDSGDMLRGDNAKALAALLSSRLDHAHTL